MSALKNNPFLVGFGVVMALGVGALGYLTYSASEEHSKALEEYESTAAELKTLQSGKPYPEPENLKKIEEQKKLLQAKIHDLQASLAAQKIKVEDISPTGFQDKLTNTVARIAAKAPEANVKLPGNDKEKFYLGFNLYQSEPPKGPAAPLLYRELRAIEAVMNLILSVRNVEVKELTREELKEEKAPKTAPVATGNKKGAVAEDSPKTVQKDSFTIQFKTSQENARAILNGLVTHKEQFFIPRYIVVQNEKQDAPPKAAPDAAAPAVPQPAAPTPPAPGAAPAPGEAPAKNLEHIFGKELVDVTLQIDLVDIKEPQALATAPAKPTPKNK